MTKKITVSDGVRIEETFFPNGNVKSEVSYVGELIQGTTRKWHENGILRSETPMLDSKPHGLVREWNSEGELLGESEFINGTGIHRSWFPDGRLRYETWVRDGVPHGRMRGWDEGGELLVEQFFVSGRKVSKKKYDGACSKDPSLPTYQEDGLRPSLVPDTLPQSHTVSPPVSLAEYPDAQEAVAWLQASTDDSLRNLGELPLGEESMDLAQEFLRHGAANVFVVNIQRDDDGSLNSGHLLIELPHDSKDRQKALKRINQQNVEVGFNSERDSGQQFVLVALD